MKATILSAAIALVLIAGAFLLSDSNSSSSKAPEAMATVVDGVQVVDITARGGYSPRVVQAKAGLPTRLRVTTQSTYDCSIALRIPDIGFRSNLPPTGVTEIEVPPQEPGRVLRGLCSMGMYGFQIVFQ